MIKSGYAQKILRVNRTNRTYIEEPLTQDLAKNYMGGARFGRKYYFN